MDRVWESWLALLIMISSGIGLAILAVLLSVPVMVTLAFNDLRAKPLRERILGQRDKAVPASASH